MAEFSSLSFELDGIPKMLISLDEVEAAIAKGTIAPDTRVTVYLSDRSSSAKAAGSHAVLAPIFARNAPAPDPEMPPAPAPDGPAKPILADRSPASPALQDAVEAQLSPQDPSIWQAPPSTTIFLDRPSELAPKKRGCGKTLAMLIAGAFVLILLVRLFGGDPNGAGFVPDYVDDWPSVDTASAAGMDDAAKAAASGTFYLIRATNVRAAPNANAAKWDMLPRGTEVTGVFVPSQNDANAKWLRLSDGEFAGGYVSAINIIENMPPVLETKYAGTYILTEEVPLYAGASSNGDLVGRGPSYLSAGQRVTVTGHIADMVEIEQIGGGVAYMESSAIADQLEP